MSTGAPIAASPCITSSRCKADQNAYIGICAAQPYGAGILPTQTLSMFWTQGPPGYEAEGGIGISGAAADSFGIIGANTSAGQTVLFDVPVLFDLSPGFLTLDVNYGAFGSLGFPVSLREPSLAGLSLYAQAFELNPSASQGVYAPNGLVLLFGN